MLFLGHFVVVNWSEQLAVMQVMELLSCFHLQGLCVCACVCGKEGLAKCGAEDDSQNEGNIRGEQSEGMLAGVSCFSNVCRLHLPSLLLNMEFLSNWSASAGRCCHKSGQKSWPRSLDLELGSVLGSCLFRGEMSSVEVGGWWFPSSIHHKPIHQSIHPFSSAYSLVGSGRFCSLSQLTSGWGTPKIRGGQSFLISGRIDF